jgi:hypothetical protein
MAPTRTVPVVGASAQVRRLGHTDPVVIVAVRGTEVIVTTDDGDTLTFVLHRGKGHFYLAGAEGSTGPRLVLGAPAAGD